ncbi:MAG: DUF1553 domain-containing protein [Pirellulaceae bacterium]
MKLISRLIVAFAIQTTGIAMTFAQLTDNAPVEFSRDVYPILVSKCLDCHGQDKQESGYRLDNSNAALGSADFGEPPIVPGDAMASPLYVFISDPDADIVMPPPDSGTRLSSEDVSKIRRWIDDGANWPDSAQTAISTDHWAFQPLAKVVPPIIADQDDSEASPIDGFILDQLNQAGLELSHEADRRVLIRRIYLDMLGLLPTPEEVEAFVNDESPAAWDNVVDHVLSSPHYGERWARHWLDVVRFGESTGYEVNRDRANAWHYRDYVINSLNNDKSYRDFVIEQIAGDVTGCDEATGFLVGGPYDIVKSPDINLTLMQRQDELADYVNTTSTTFLGLTVACARCHNHKFDPILQKDYYAMQAVFSGVHHGERKLQSTITEQQVDQLRIDRERLTALESQFQELAAQAPSAPVAPSLRPMVNALLNEETFDPIEAKWIRFSIRQTNLYEPCFDEIEIFSTDDQNVALSSHGSIATSSGDYSGNPKHQLKHVNDGIYGNDHSWIANTTSDAWLQIELPAVTSINRIKWARDREGAFNDRLAIDYSIEVSADGKIWSVVGDSAQRQPYLADGKESEDAFIARLSDEVAHDARALWDEIKSLRKQIQDRNESIPTAYVGTFSEAEPIYRLYRGEPQQPRELVDPGILSVMGQLAITNETPESERRLKFAQWLVSEDNPLTARVIVNRVWQHHFGTGIVSTPSDFGKNGFDPTHPELLDWLSNELIQHNWSLKWLHRQILTSSTYRQSSQPNPKGLEVDAGSRWLWRYPPRRLEAEAIRDCVLQVSGKLNLAAGGPGFLLFEVDRENVHHYFPLKEFSDEHFRRMIYMTKIRQEQEDVFGAFDCPDGGQTIPSRGRSTTPLQSLNLLNSQFMIEQAAFLSQRLQQEAPSDISSQIQTAYHIAYSRLPTAEEQTDAVAFIQEFGLEAFCRALLNSNEFLFLG